MCFFMGRAGSAVISEAAAALRSRPAASAGTRARPPPRTAPDGVWRAHLTSLDERFVQRHIVASRLRPPSNTQYGA